ncbi:MULTISPECIES: hypothetical protein [unclassified Exiguobacterium]|uniref:hypothetical protein n=1 Tax=unclassified Exiguobacterium TaxID=2644629 RepID=UPI0025C23353|nr:MULTISPECIES: hypothetical protein [unclassified Exiguobacterium]
MGTVAVYKSEQNDDSYLDKFLENKGPIAVCFTDDFGDTVAFQLDAELMKKYEIAKTITLKTK